MDKSRGFAIKWLPQAHQMLGLTIPDLLAASGGEYPKQASFFKYRHHAWQSYTHQDLRYQVSMAALGLLGLGLKKGDRVGFLLNSDFEFLVADLACATANLVSVPVDLSQTIENIIFCLQHSDSKVLIVQSHSLLCQISPYLDSLKDLEAIVVYAPECVPQETQTSFMTASSPDHRPLRPSSVGLDLDTRKHVTSDESLFKVHPHCSWCDLLKLGKQFLANHPDQLHELGHQRSPQDLATIIYTPDDSGALLGVMLSHQNLTHTALSSFSGMTGVRKGDRESVVTFLPLTHIFARMMLYGHLYYGHRVYFSTPRRVMKHLQELKPTILTTVPLLLHRVYRRLNFYGCETHPHAPSQRSTVLGIDVSRITRATHQWAMAIAPKKPQNLQEKLEAVLARPIFYQWRKIFGGRIRFCLSGGAALDPTVAQFFVGIGFPLYQGYGLTQTSSTVTFNHPEHNFPGTVGQTRKGVECAIAPDGEILVRGNGNMMGYFKSPQPPVINPQGWLHTGDLGHLDGMGNLTILGSKKSLFKLTTGKYVTPTPLEETLMESPLIRHSLVVGNEQKFCAALLFVDPHELQKQARKMGLVHYPVDALLENSCIQALFQSLVDQANCHFPYWSTIKKIRLLPATDYPYSLRGYAPDSLRHRLVQRFAPLIEQLYQGLPEKRALKAHQVSECPDVPWVACPVTAQSLNTRAS